jgi:hypothetical protein
MGTAIDNLWTGSFNQILQDKYHDSVFWRRYKLRRYALGAMPNLDRKAVVRWE